MLPRYGTGHKAMVAGAAADMTAVLAALQAEVAGLRQGLGLMLETQATHTEMLRHLLTAAAAPEAAESTLADNLTRIATTLDRQSGDLEALRTVLDGLPREIGAMVAQGVREALGEG
jgi:hypothetical protein